MREDRKPYADAWSRLFDMVLARNDLLRGLQDMIEVAKGSTPAAGVVVGFDVIQARTLLVEIEKLSVEILAQVLTVNELAKGLGAPEVEWYSPDGYLPRDGDPAA
jgi:hypothetical protein